MRLSVSLLLVTLALCCYEARAGLVCPDLIAECTKFLVGTPKALEAQLQKYGAPPEAVKARLESKKCIDNLSPEDKALILEAMTEIVAQCVLKI